MAAIIGLDLVITEDEEPLVVELNGAMTGFDGLLSAEGDDSLQKAFASRLEEISRGGRWFGITRIVRTGVLPDTYLAKAVKDALYFRRLANLKSGYPDGRWGTTWIRTENAHTLPRLGPQRMLAGLDDDPRFGFVMQDVCNPDHVLRTSDYGQGNRSYVPVAKGHRGRVEPIELEDGDVLWMRCGPPAAYAPPPSQGRLMNPFFPHEAFLNNKWFAYSLCRSVAPNHVPASIPIGARTSGAGELDELLASTDASTFIRKPLVSGQAKGVELLSRPDVEDYRDRLARVEEKEVARAAPPWDVLEGSAQMMAAGVLAHEVSILSECRPSKPVLARRSGERHHGCMRAVVLLDRDRVHFIGAFWRLSGWPADGDALPGDRLVASLARGGYCEAASPEDTARVEEFVTRLIPGVAEQLQTLPMTLDGHHAWETAHWMGRYASSPALRTEKAWAAFGEMVTSANARAARLREEAREKGYLATASALFTREQAALRGLPPLLAEPHRVGPG